MAKKKRSKIVGKRRLPSGLTPHQKAFLLKIEEVGAISKACRILGIDRTEHYKTWRYEPVYAEEFKKAVELHNEFEKERTMVEMTSRAFDGWDEEVIEEEREAVTIQRDDGTSETKMVPKKIKRRTVKRYSQGCLMWLGNLHHGNPSRLEVTGKDGGTLKISVEAAREIHDAVTNGKNGDE